MSAAAYDHRVPLPADAPSAGALDLFVTVVQTGSLSAAALRHGISQPSASARIRHLERQLGVQLLVRGPSGSRPTEAGAVVAGWAETVVDSLDTLLTGVAAITTGGTGLRVAASYTVSEHLLPRWLGRLRTRRPDLPVELEVVNSAAVIQRVHDQAVDVGFVESPGDLPGLREEVVAQDRLVTVVAPDHPWARRRRPVPLATLAATALVLRERGSGTRDALEAALASLGTHPAEAALELSSTSAVRAAVESGAGPAVLSHLAVAEALGAGRLCAVDVAGLDLRRDLRAVWPRTRALTPAARALLDLARPADPAP